MVWPPPRHPAGEKGWDDPGPAAQEAPASEAPDAAPSGEPLETFEPTEKLAAESAVSFPVDI